MGALTSARRAIPSLLFSSLVQTLHPSLVQCPPTPLLVSPPPTLTRRPYSARTSPASSSPTSRVCRTFAHQVGRCLGLPRQVGRIRQVLGAFLLPARLHL